VAEFLLRKQCAREGNSPKRPVPLYSAGSDFKDLRDLLDGEAAEVSQCNHFGLAGALNCEPGESFINGDIAIALRSSRVVNRILRFWLAKIEDCMVPF
jgi:hypothetical protein